MNATRRLRLGLAAVGVVALGAALSLQLDCRLLGVDACRSNRVLTRPATDVDAVIVELEAIEDPTLRGATLLSWTDKHRGELSMDRTERICALLPAEEALWCRRHLGSSHLSR